jgi:hypothetical protein
VDQVTSRLRVVSALLTLLLTVLLGGALPESNGGSGQSAPSALVQLDVAQAAASLKGAQSAGAAQSQQADDDTNSGDDGALATDGVGGSTWAGGSTFLISDAANAPHCLRGYQARAPPAV